MDQSRDEHNDVNSDHRDWSSGLVVVAGGLPFMSHADATSHGLGGRVLHVRCGHHLLQAGIEGVLQDEGAGLGGVAMTSGIGTEVPADLNVA